MEHLSRGTIRHVDLVLILAEAYYRSLETAARLGELARELGIPLVYAVANKVRTDREAELIRSFCRARNLPLTITCQTLSPRSLTKSISTGRPLGRLVPIILAGKTFVLFTTTTSPGASKDGRSLIR